MTTQTKMPTLKNPPVVVTRQVNASAEKVWSLATDLPRMGEWSLENKGGEWLNGATGPAVGAKFKGHNQNGKKRWDATVEILECDEPNKIVFALVVGKSRWCDWVWEITPTTDGCLVTHSWLDYRSWFADKVGGILSNVKDRSVHNRKNMEATLEAIAKAAE